MPFPTRIGFCPWRHATAAALAVLCLTAGCNNKPDDRWVVYVDTSTEAVEVMTKPRGTLGLGGTPKSVWLDPRSEKEYAAGHIPGAVNLPFPRLEDEQEVVLKDVDVIVVYDTDYDDTLVKPVAKQLMFLGHKDVLVLRGGLKAWKRDGNPVATGAAPGGNAPPASKATPSE